MHPDYETFIDLAKAININFPVSLFEHQNNNCASFMKVSGVMKSVTIPKNSNKKNLFEVTD
jgi:hypothetical protein